jgi:ABC-type sulfate transport system permease subunit
MRTTTPTLSDSSTVPLPAAHSRPRLSDNETFCGWLFITPALVGFTLFYLLPTIRAFYIGLTNWNLLRAPKFLGLENYSRLLGDEKFWSSIWITVLYVVYNIPVQTVLGQLIAVLLKRLTGSVFVRSIMLAPIFDLERHRRDDLVLDARPSARLRKFHLTSNRPGKPRILQ